ncbi:MAG: cyclopropane-fatty-acyl-phospholipid synthase [Promethearchaeota archaeon CR_4]|nr:MAG: cyclopropane-fatty-acyl-phospholipid synthase [Candidatus Lokiarchaeota archaeon CR_4]
MRIALAEVKRKCGSFFGKSFELVADFLYNVVSDLKLKKTSKFLDIGTGSGIMSIILAIQDFKIITGEPAGDNWADWQTPVKSLGLEKQISFQPFRAEALPFNDASFDAIFIFGSFHHIAEKTLTLQECSRCLKATGVLVIFEFHPKGIALLRKEIPNHPDAANPLDYLGQLQLSYEIRSNEYMNAYIFHKK